MHSDPPTPHRDISHHVVPCFSIQVPEELQTAPFVMFSPILTQLTRLVGPCVRWSRCVRAEPPPPPKLYGAAGLGGRHQRRTGSYPGAPADRLGLNTALGATKQQTEDKQMYYDQRINNTEQRIGCSVINSSL